MGPEADCNGGSDVFSRLAREGAVPVSFIDEGGRLLHESEMRCVPRVGDEVRIADEAARLGPLGWAKAVVGMLSDDDVPDATCLEGQVIRVIWCLRKDLGGTEGATVVVRPTEHTA